MTIQRREFLTALIAVVPAPFIARRAVMPRPHRVLIQESPLAGFQYHNGERLWHRLRTGDSLQLHREPGNPHDKRAVRVDWHAEKLGYLPRIENTAVAQMLDRGESVVASITDLKRDRDPWRRMRLAAYIEV